MKTLKFLAVLFTISFITVVANAQAVVSKIMSRPYSQINQCIGERITGYTNFHFLTLYDKDGNISGSQMKAAGGSLVGQTTGNIYNFKFLFLDNYKAPWPEDTEQYNGAYRETYIGMRHIVCRGNENVSFTTLTIYKVTITPHGDIIMDESDVDTTCKQTFKYWNINLPY